MNESEYCAGDLKMGGKLASHLTFGELMMVAGAFTQVQTSLRWFIDNFAVIADWQATLLRIADFRTALIGLAQVEGIISGSQVSKQVDKDMAGMNGFEQTPIRKASTSLSNQGVRAPIARIERQARFLSLAIKSKPSRAAFRGEPLIE